MVDCLDILYYGGRIAGFLGGGGKPAVEFARFLWNIRIPEDVLLYLRYSGFYRWEERDGQVFYVLGKGAFLLYAAAFRAAVKKGVRMKKLRQATALLPPEWRERFEVLQEVTA